jgi:DNA repair photolyase
LPFINDTDTNIIKIVKQAKQCGVRYIYPAFGVTLRQNQRDYFYEQLDRHFPGLKQKYMQTFGERYICDSPDASRLSRVFQQECDNLKIITKMSDIIADYQSGVGDEQLKLF